MAGYRPKEWRDQPQLTYLQATKARGEVVSYFFDAVLKVEHSTGLRITEHPVQDGANISDHAFLQPAQVILEIGASDVMDSFVQGNAGGASANHSVSAYQALADLQRQRTPLKLITRLQNYDNMLIEQLSAPDDYKTLKGLRCTAVLKQIIVAVVPVVKISSIPHASTSTQLGPVQAQPVTNPTVLRSVGQYLGIE